MIQWTRERRKLSDLVPWERNPRQIRRDQANRLADSLDEFGQIQAIAIGPDDEIYDGHQRKNVWATLDRYGPDYEIDVRVASRALTEAERQKLVIYLHQGAHGEWDFDELANWDFDDLLEWGFKHWELGVEKPDIDYDEMWQGMPEFGQDDLGPVKSIKVHFATQDDIAAFANLIEQRITEKTKFVWYPKMKRANLKALAIKDES